jgi:hypothetical protein
MTKTVGTHTGNRFYILVPTPRPTISDNRTEAFFRLRRAQAAINRAVRAADSQNVVAFPLGKLRTR